MSFLPIAHLGCGPLEPNRPIFIEDGFDEAEAAAVQLAIESWNAVGRERVGSNLIDCRGRFDDRDGFVLERNVSDDDPVVYRIADAGTYRRLTEGLPGKTGGIRFGDDIVLFVEILKSDPEADYLTAIQSVATHELGHWLGLPDERSLKRRDSVMYWAGGASDELKLEPTPYDSENICRIYECVR
jgi:hypothetical protein